MTPRRCASSPHPNKAAELGLKPLVRLVSWGVAGVAPNIMGIGPVPATERALAKAGLALSDIDLIELNEAFAAQALACMREWQFTDADLRAHQRARVGHLARAPRRRDRRAGCSPPWRANSTLRDARYGLETMCIGGGQGLAAVFERISAR